MERFDTNDGISSNVQPHLFEATALIHTRKGKFQEGQDFMIIIGYYSVRAKKNVNQCDYSRFFLQFVLIGIYLKHVTNPNKALKA